MNFIRWLTVLCAVFVSFSLSAYHAALFDELKTMYEEDQNVRFELIDSGNLTSEELIQKMEMVDQENLPRLKEIIHQFGWPGFKLVGEEGADKMWLLVQHCDRDIEFQKACLQLLKEAVAKADAPKRHLAYLMDRILVNEDLPQVYGTQFQIIEGKAIFCPIQEPEKLDSRRAEMGLESFADYFSALKELYHIEEF
jgi:hypothetical protein